MRGTCNRATQKWKRSLQTSKTFEDARKMAEGEPRYEMVKTAPTVGYRMKGAEEMEKNEYLE